MVAKGAFKTNSQLVSKTQVLNICDFLLARGRNLDIIKEAKLIKQYKQINVNYDALIYANFFADILDHIAVSDDHYDEPFSLMSSYLNELNQACLEDSERLAYISCKYLWLLVEMLGYKPDLNTCSVTHRERQANHTPQYFDFAGGGVTSHHGYLQELQDNPYQDNIRSLSPGVFKVLNAFDNKDFTHNSESQELEDSFKLLHKHLSFRLHKEFKSWKLLEPVLQAKEKKALHQYSNFY